MKEAIVFHMLIFLKNNVIYAYEFA